MEQRDRVRLTTSNTFDLEREEIKRLYIYLSLSQYRFLRTPDYSTRLLIATLEKDFRKFHAEMQIQTERDPNNLTLYKIRGFFDNHYKRIKELKEELGVATSG